MDTIWQLHTLVVMNFLSAHNSLVGACACNIGTCKLMSHKKDSEYMGRVSFRGGGGGGGHWPPLESLLPPLE